MNVAPAAPPAMGARVVMEDRVAMRGRDPMGVPGAMVFLGIGNASLGTTVNLHNPKFKMDEEQMQLGAALHVEMALRSLAKPPLGCGGAETADDADLAGEPASMHAQCGEGTNMEDED